MRSLLPRSVYVPPGGSQSGKKVRSFFFFLILFISPFIQRQQAICNTLRWHTSRQTCKQWNAHNHHLGTLHYECQVHPIAIYGYVAWHASPLNIAALKFSNVDRVYIQWCVQNPTAGVFLAFVSLPASFPKSDAPACLPGWPDYPSLEYSFDASRERKCPMGLNIQRDERTNRDRMSNGPECPTSNQDRTSNVPGSPLLHLWSRWIFILVGHSDT